MANHQAYALVFEVFGIAFILAVLTGFTIFLWHLSTHVKAGSTVMICLSYLMIVCFPGRSTKKACFC